MRRIGVEKMAMKIDTCLTQVFGNWKAFALENSHLKEQLLLSAIGNCFYAC